MAVGICFKPSRPWNPLEGCAEMHCTPGTSRFRRREAREGAQRGAEFCVAPAGLLDDLRPGVLEMRLPVRRVVVLIGVKIAVRIGQVNFAAQRSEEHTSELQSL